VVEATVSESCRQLGGLLNSDVVELDVGVPLRPSGEIPGRLPVTNDREFHKLFISPNCAWGWFGTPRIHEAILPIRCSLSLNLELASLNKR